MRDGVQRATLATWFLCAGAVFGQGAGGVFLDADKVLRWKQAAKGSAAKKIAKARAGMNTPAGDLAYISLPKILAEYQQLIRSGQSIPREISCLGGMTRLEYVFAYPDQKDLVIAGPAEDIDASDPDRPVGKSSGRPTLRLDDLIVCFHVLGPTHRPGVFGCSLDLPDGALAKMQQAAQQIGAVSGGDNEAVARAIGQAVGLQDVRLFGVPEDTNAAFVCIEADYILKRLGQGRMRSPVKSVKSFMALMKQNDSAYNRWWFVPNYEAVLADADGLSFELQSKGLLVQCSASANSDNVKPGPGASKFAELVTEHFTELENAIPAFADLTNICDLTVLAALCRTEKLDTLVGWDVQSIGTADCPFRKRLTPREVESVTAHKRGGRTVTVAVGGVTFNADDALKSKKTSKQAVVKKKAKRPTTGWLLRPERPAG